jgi:hypothetical protein
MRSRTKCRSDSVSAPSHHKAHALFEHPVNAFSFDFKGGDLH